MATKNDIELAERFLNALERELEEISKRVNKTVPQIFTENAKWHLAVRALIDHAKRTVPEQTPPPAFNNPANAGDYATMHDFFERGGK